MDFNPSTYAKRPNSLESLLKPTCACHRPSLSLSLLLCHGNISLIPPLYLFPSITFFILPSDSVKALWSQSSQIYVKPLHALHFWRRGGERDYSFFLCHSSFLWFLSLLALILPASFHSDLNSSKFPSEGANDTTEA